MRFQIAGSWFRALGLWLEKQGKLRRLRDGSRTSSAEARLPRCSPGVASIGSTPARRGIQALSDQGTRREGDHGPHGWRGCARRSSSTVRAGRVEWPESDTRNVDRKTKHSLFPITRRPCLSLDLPLNGCVRPCLGLLTPLGPRRGRPRDCLGCRRGPPLVRRITRSPPRAAHDATSQGVDHIQTAGIDIPRFAGTGRDTQAPQRVPGDRKNALGASAPVQPEGR